MNWESGGVVREQCVVFWKVAEEFGGLSNMSNEFPLRVGGVQVGSTEALYQACRFPLRADWQEEILAAPHAFAAKLKAKKGGRKGQSRPDWEIVCGQVMRWCLQVKLAQHFGLFSALLRASADHPIVERSRKDRYWGAVLEKDGVLRGENRLGCLLGELRDEIGLLAEQGQADNLLEVAPPAIAEFCLLGQPVRQLEPIPVP